MPGAWRFRSVSPRSCACVRLACVCVCACIHVRVLVCCVPGRARVNSSASSLNARQPAPCRARDAGRRGSGASRRRGAEFRRWARAPGVGALVRRGVSFWACCGRRRAWQQARDRRCRGRVSDRTCQFLQRSGRPHCAWPHSGARRKEACGPLPGGGRASPRPPSVHHRAGSYRLGPPRTRPAQRPCAKPSPCPGSGVRGGDVGQSRGGAPRCPPDGGPGSASRWRPDRALRPPAPRACPAGGDTSLGPLRRLRLPGRLGGRGRGHCLAPSGGSDHLACQFEDRASLLTPVLSC